MIQPAKLYSCDLTGLIDSQNAEQIDTAQSVQNVCMILPQLDCLCIECQREREERGGGKKEEWTQGLFLLTYLH